MTNAERYTWCRDKIEGNSIIKWDEWAEDMELDVPLECTGDDHRLYVQRRNSIKQQINKMAQTRDANWRLLSYTAGKEIIKSVNDELIKRDIPSRAQRIMKHMGAAKSEIEAFARIEGILQGDKKYCNEMISTLIGCTAFIYGQIKGMSGMGDKEREALLSIVDMNADKKTG